MNEEMKNAFLDAKKSMNDMESAVIGEDFDGACATMQEVIGALQYVIDNMNDDSDNTEEEGEEE